MMSIAEIMFWGGLVTATVSFVLLWLDRQLELRKQLTRPTD
jgi:hypothetical protein